MRDSHRLLMLRLSWPLNHSRERGMTTMVESTCSGHMQSTPVQMTRNCIDIGSNEGSGLKTGKVPER